MLLAANVVNAIKAFCFCDKQGFPVVFHGVMGKDEREENSPSFFNVTEIEVIISYLKKLMETQGKKGLPKLGIQDIGIIAPYRKQARRKFEHFYFNYIITKMI